MAIRSGRRFGRNRDGSIAANIRCHIRKIFRGENNPSIRVIQRINSNAQFQIATITDVDEFYRKINWLSISAILLGTMAGVATFLQRFMLNVAGTRLTHRLRSAVFEASLKQEMGWYDEAENAVGALSARLSGDCSTVRGATGSQIGSILQAISTILIGVCVSFYFSWHLTIVSIALVPIVLAACFLEARCVRVGNSV